MARRVADRPRRQRARRDPALRQARRRLHRGRRGRPRPSRPDGVGGRRASTALPGARSADQPRDKVALTLARLPPATFLKRLERFLRPCRLIPRAARALQPLPTVKGSPKGPQRVGPDPLATAARPWPPATAPACPRTSPVRDEDSRPSGAASPNGPRAPACRRKPWCSRSPSRATCRLVRSRGPQVRCGIPSCGSGQTNTGSGRAARWKSATGERRCGSCDRDWANQAFSKVPRSRRHRASRFRDGRVAASGRCLHASCR